MAKKTKKKEVTTLTTPEVVNKVEIPALTGLEVVAQKALELAESNSKAIKELTDKIQKSFTEYHHTLMLLKERNRLR